MQLSIFSNKNHILLSNIVYKLCEQANMIMSKSKDPLHDQKHIEYILDNLDKFINENKKIATEINYEVLLLAICWHDVWKSYRTQTQNLIKMLYDQYFDGLGSVKIFEKYTKDSKLDKQIREQVKYAIKKHSSFQFRKRTTLESKILVDLDNLETWNLKRYEYALHKYQKSKNLTQKMLGLAKFYFEHFMLKSTSENYYFPWTREKFTALKRQNAPKLEKLYSELHRQLD